MNRISNLECFKLLSFHSLVSFSSYVKEFYCLTIGKMGISKNIKFLALCKDRQPQLKFHCLFLQAF